jgi:hypothetical protein
MIVHSAEVSFGKLQALPRDELVYLVQALDFANEIAFLLKALLVHMPNNRKKAKPPERTAEIAQSIFYTELLAGKTYEFWETTKQSYFGCQISRKYQNLLKQDALDALNRLKTYFLNPQNEVYRIRNWYAFHSDRQQINKMLDQVKPDTTCSVHFTESYVNTWFEFASGITNNAMLGAISSGAPIHHQQLIANILLPIIGDIQLFTHSLGVEMIESFDPQITTDDDVAVPKLDDLHMPFFIER